MSSEMFKKLKHHQLRTTKFKNKSIEIIKSRIGWQGIGTKEDPIIINDLKGLKPTLVFRTSELYLIVKDVTVFKI